MTSKKETPDYGASDTQKEGLTSLEETILRMRYGLLKNHKSQPSEREIDLELKKKLQFLELKAFEQSGKIKELLNELEKKGSKTQE